jgi:Fur family ferric uptake transcriptional regulator
MEIENSCQNGYRASSPDVADRLLRTLVGAGHSNTRPRQVVVEVIASTEGCFSPFEVLERGRQQHARLGLTTVYRTLELLASMGLVRKIHQDDGCHSYALVEKAHGHHIICERCHQVVEFEGCDLAPLLETISQETGYEVRGHWLELFGVCPHCQK